MSGRTAIEAEVLSRIPMNARRILQIGCGDGSFGLLVKARNPSAFFFGVEQCDDLALQAHERLDGVLNGNIKDESAFEALVSLRKIEPFDVLIFWDDDQQFLDVPNLLTKFRSLVSEHGVCVACIAEAANNSPIRQWSLSSEHSTGASSNEDASQVFTSDGIAKLFGSTGWTVFGTPSAFPSENEGHEIVGIIEPSIAKQASRFELVGQQTSALHWVNSASNGVLAAPICVAALAIRKIAGVNEARIDYPLASLNSLPSVRAIWAQESLRIPKEFKPGILILHRQFLNNSAFAMHIEKLIAVGWIIVSEIDDDPNHWRGYVDSDFIAFRGVHAVSVSTEKLAIKVSAYNPHVTVFENAIFELPSQFERPAGNTRKLRVFFGALNRLDDWNEIKGELIPALSEINLEIEFVVMHDEDAYKSLPPDLTKEFYSTLPPQEYLKVLATCDIALLPLRDTSFNSLKSDLKLIECCACGAVPIFSNIVYGNTAGAEGLGVMMNVNDNWGAALIELVRNPKRITRLRAAGLTYVKSERMHCHLLGRRMSWLQGLIADKDRLEAERLVRLRAMGLTSLVFDAKS